MQEAVALSDLSSGDAEQQVQQAAAAPPPPRQAQQQHSGGQRSCRDCGATEPGKHWCRHPVTKAEWYCRRCYNAARWVLVRQREQAAGGCDEGAAAPAKRPRLAGNDGAEPQQQQQQQAAAGQQERQAPPPPQQQPPQQQVAALVAAAAPPLPADVLGLLLGASEQLSAAGLAPEQLGAFIDLLSSKPEKVRRAGAAGWRSMPCRLRALPAMPALPHLLTPACPAHPHPLPQEAGLARLLQHGQPAVTVGFIRSALAAQPRPAP